MKGFFTIPFLLIRKFSPDIIRHSIFMDWQCVFLSNLFQLLNCLSHGNTMSDHTKHFKPSLNAYLYMMQWPSFPIGPSNLIFSPSIGGVPPAVAGKITFPSFETDAAPEWLKKKKADACHQEHPSQSHQYQKMLPSSSLFLFHRILYQRNHWCGFLFTFWKTDLP